LETERRTRRVPIMLTDSELQELDEWWHSHRLKTRGEAVRDMMRKAREYEKAAGSDAR
jgi:metal-responsive CopG/Arc/MetJ family transcriptional regulator